jgi:hypothetical protein
MLDYPALRPLSLVVLTLNKVLWWVLPPLTVRRGCWASSSHTVVNPFLFLSLSLSLLPDGRSLKASL